MITYAQDDRDLRALAISRTWVALGLTHDDCVVFVYRYAGQTCASTVQARCLVEAEQSWLTFRAGWPKRSEGGIIYGRPARFLCTPGQGVGASPRLCGVAETWVCLARKETFVCRLF